MDTALPQKFPFILDRNLAKANCTGNRVCTSCDIVVLDQKLIIRKIKVEYKNLIHFEINEHLRDHLPIFLILAVRNRCFPITMARSLLLQLARRVWAGKEGKERRKGRNWSEGKDVSQTVFGEQISLQFKINCTRSCLPKQQFFSNSGQAKSFTQ